MRPHCPGGGIGRRAGFRYQWPKGLGSSSLLLGTILLVNDKITLHQGDLPADLTFGSIVAIDTETMGLRPERDRLCLVQLSSGDGTVHLVQFNNRFDAPNLKRLLTDPSVVKLFHFARFDVAVLKAYLGFDAILVHQIGFTSTPR